MPCLVIASAGSPLPPAFSETPQDAAFELLVKRGRGWTLPFSPVIHDAIQADVVEPTPLSHGEGLAVGVDGVCVANL